MKLKHIIIAAIITLGVYLINTYWKGVNGQTSIEMVAEELLPDSEKETALEIVRYYLMCDTISKEFEYKFIAHTPEEIEQVKEAIKYLKEAEKEEDKQLVKVAMDATVYGLEQDRVGLAPPDIFGDEQGAIKELSDLMGESARQLLVVKATISRYVGEYVGVYGKYTNAQKIEALEEVLPQLIENYNNYKDSKAQLLQKLSPKTDEALLVLENKLPINPVYSVYKTYIEKACAFVEVLKQQVNPKERDIRAVKNAYDDFNEYYNNTIVSVDEYNEAYLNREAFQYVDLWLWKIENYFPSVLDELGRGETLEDNDFYNGIIDAQERLKEFSYCRFFMVDK